MPVTSIPVSYTHLDVYKRQGQMSFFDIAPEEDKGNFQVSFSDVGEFDKETLLAFEKETLGIYVSGHPMEAYQELSLLHI